MKRKKSRRLNPSPRPTPILSRRRPTRLDRSRRWRRTGSRRPHSGWGRSPTGPPTGSTHWLIGQPTRWRRWPQRPRRNLVGAATLDARPLAAKVGPLAQQVGDTVGPYALLAKQRGAQAAQEVIEKWRPALEEAMETRSPLGWRRPRTRINEDLLPKLVAALEAAAAAPVVVEASKRGQATLAAAKGELTLPEVQTKPKRRWLKRLIVIGVVGGVVVVVARRLLGGQDADWQAARPTAPYAAPAPPTPPPATNGQTQDAAETRSPESVEAG